MTDKNTVTLLAGGDIGRFDLKAELTDEFAELILPTLRQADLRFGQCESTYSKRALGIQLPYGSQANAHPRQASLWNAAGIDVISLASNNTMKMGPEALMDTIDLFRAMNKHIIGAGQDMAAARKPAILERKGVKIAFLAYCSVLAEGHDAGQGKAGIAPMRAHTYYMRAGDPHEESQPGTPQRIFTVPHEEDLRALQDDVRQAKQQADVVVMSIHWGLHHIPKAIATYQPEIAHAAIDAGADLILGHHPHCLKAVEVYKGKVCFYSLGNFMVTSDPKLATPSKWNRWNLWWYRVDSEYLPPNAIFHYPPHCRKTMIAKAVFSKNGVEKVSFLPAFINPQAQPAVVAPEDPKFQEILGYMEWVSDQHRHKFRVEGNEIVVDTLSPTQ